MVYLHQFADEEQGGEGLRAELRTWREADKESERGRYIVRESQGKRVRERQKHRQRGRYIVRERQINRVRERQIKSQRDSETDERVKARESEVYTEERDRVIRDRRC